MHLCAQFKFELHTHAPVHINWLKNQIYVLGCMLRSHARNGNEFQTPGHRWLLAKYWDAGFLNSSKSKTRLKLRNLACYHGAATTCCGKKIVPFGASLGICFYKLKLLTTSMMVFGRERPTFGDERISIASYCFQFFSRVNVEQQECCVIFCYFSGFIWTFLCINWVFDAFYVHNSNLDYMHMFQCI